LPDVTPPRGSASTAGKRGCSPQRPALMAVVAAVAAPAVRWRLLLPAAAATAQGALARVLAAVAGAGGVASAPTPALDAHAPMLVPAMHLVAVAVAAEGGGSATGGDGAAAVLPPPVLEIEVADLDTAVPLAIAAGATLAHRVRYGVASKSALLHVAGLPALAIALVQRPTPLR